MFYQIVEGLAVTGTIIGLYCLSEQLLAYGFFIGALSNILWVFHGKHLEKGGVGIISVNTILLFVNINGFGGI